MNHNHPLIKTSHNFVLDRKVLFIDSNDRDIERWPSASEFEINCPQNYTNVESLRLSSIMLPNFFYNISDQLRTNKMIVEYDNSSTIITLDDGYYNYTQLQDALQSKFQLIHPNFDVSYNLINRKFTFLNVSIAFPIFIKFPDTALNANSAPCPIVFNAKTKGKITAAALKSP